MIEAESATPECVRHICDVVFAQDVAGEASGARHDAGIIPDPALILVAGDIADIMISVFDSPMTSDRGGPFRRWVIGGGRDVEGGLLALMPQAGGGRVQQRAAGDTDHGLDEWLPLGSGQGITDGKDLNSPIFLT